MFFIFFPLLSLIERTTGGQEVLDLAAGREATHIFESYHKLSSKVHYPSSAYSPLSCIDACRPSLFP